MRIRVGDGNPLTLRAVVMLDGVKQKLAIMADSDKGIVERYVQDGQNPNSWPTETVHGVVDIIDPDTEEPT